MTTMMKKLSFLLPGDGLIPAFRRFPVSIACAILLFLFIVAASHDLINVRDPLKARLTLLLVCGYFLSGGIALFAESRAWGWGRTLALTAPALAGIAAILFLSPYTGVDNPTIDVHGKQSSLGLYVQGPEICGMQSGGGVITYFYGESLLEDRQGLFIPRGYGELKSDEWRFAFGALGDVINPRIPMSLDFATGQGGGNLGAFRGQFRAEHYINFNNDAQLTLQGGLGNPLSTSFVGDIRTLLEDNGWPNLEGRMMLGLGPTAQRGPLQMRPFEVAVSGLVGEIRRTGANRAIFDVWAVGADARIEFTDRCGIKAEVFRGQAIGNYNAAIIQIFNPFTLQAISTTGGWAEFFIHWNDCLQSQIGFGIDDPDNGDLSPGLPSRNQFSFANLIWELDGGLQIGFEIGHYQTDYFPGAMINGRPILDNSALVDGKRGKLKF